MRPGLAWAYQESEMRIGLITALIAVGAVNMTAGAACAEEAHHQLGPHMHGHGILNIAIENMRLEMQLEVPAMDILGFEHDATTDAQKEAVEKAKAELASPLALFKLPAAAGCTVADPKVELVAERHHEGEEAGHAADDNHAAGAGHDHDDVRGGHKEFHVTYALNCARPASLTSIQFDYFKSFAGAQGLTVNVVTARAQNTYEVTRDAPGLALGGMM
jgi:hypothetical protein